MTFLYKHRLTLVAMISAPLILGIDQTVSISFPPHRLISVLVQQWRLWSSPTRPSCVQLISKTCRLVSILYQCLLFWSWFSFPFSLFYLLDNRNRTQKWDESPC